MTHALDYMNASRASDGQRAALLIPALLAEVIHRAFCRGQSFAVMMDGWLVGVNAVSSDAYLSRPVVRHFPRMGAVRYEMSRRDVIRLLLWAHLNRDNPNLEPELRAVCELPGAGVAPLYLADPVVMTLPAGRDVVDDTLAVEVEVAL